MEEVAIRVSNVNKSFKLPHERVSTVKGLFVNMFKRKRTYEKQDVLKDISFEIKKGEFFGIVGRNGSGKSTLLKLLAGIYSPDEGHIQVNGKLTPFIELGVGFNPELTGRENVFLNGALLGFSRKEMLGMYDEIVEFAELEKFMDQKLKNYSSGMQVRLAFSIAIRAQSEILLLDEVLAVGDAAFQQKCFNYFEKLKDEKKTVVFVSHDMGAVNRFCNAAIYLKDGLLVESGSASKIAQIYAEENIRDDKPDEATSTLSKIHKLQAKIENASSSKVTIRFTYSAKDNEAMYIGISISKDGYSVAEITTTLEKTLHGEGTVEYSFDPNLFNEGVYKIGAGLFRLKNRELIAVSKTRNVFSVKGKDLTKGAALRLPDNWKYN